MLNSTIPAMLIINEEVLSMTYQCTVCGWLYSEEDGYPDAGVAPGTKWEDVPDDFVCPMCGAEKDMFTEA